MDRATIGITFFTGSAGFVLAGFYWPPRPPFVTFVLVQAVTGFAAAILAWLSPAAVLASVALMLLGFPPRAGLPDHDGGRAAADADPAGAQRLHRKKEVLQSGSGAADLPELHVAWCAAIGMGLLTVEGGKASGGPELRNWPPDDGAGLLEAWLKGFFAVSAVLDGPVQDPGRGFLVLVLASLKVLQDDGAPAGRGLLREVLEEADEICDSRDLDVDVYGVLSGLSSHGMPRIEG